MKKSNIKTKTHNLYKVIFLFIVFLGIGYAFLEATLNIEGNTTVEAPELNVYVQSTSVTSGSTAGTPTIIGTDKKEVDYAIRFLKIEASKSNDRAYLMFLCHGIAFLYLYFDQSRSDKYLKQTRDYAGVNGYQELEE